MTRDAIAAFVLVVLCGCSRDSSDDVRSAARDAAAPSATPPEETPASSLRFGISPKDLFTAIGDAELSVWADNGLITDDPAMMSFIASHVQLRTYPELIDVPFTTVARFSNKGAPPGAVVIQPVTALTDRWYVLSLSSLPTDAATFKTGAPPSLGAEASRFRPGSAPVRRRVSVCEKADAKRVVIEFSEAVALDSVGSLINVGDATCSYTSPGAAPTQPILYFDCASTLSVTSGLRVVQKRGIVSPSGEALGVLDPFATSAATPVDTGDRDEVLSFSGLQESSGCVDYLQ